MKMEKEDQVAKIECVPNQSCLGNLLFASNTLGQKKNWLILDHLKIKMLENKFHLSFLPEQVKVTLSRFMNHDRCFMQTVINSPNL